jgi:hypothetical protein
MKILEVMMTGSGGLNWATSFSSCYDMSLGSTTWGVQNGTVNVVWRVKDGGHFCTSARR